MKNQTDKKDGLKIVRDFKAPRTLVFQAFSTAEAFADWWGPVGMPITIKHFDFKQGGKLHYKTEGNGLTMWGLFKYGNIVKPELIEFINSFSDEEGNICKPPFPMEFPLEIFNQITLQENNGITTLTLQGHPINATPEQEATFYSMTTNMSEGFTGTFNQLEAYLTKSKNKKD
ncbi:MAG TPA: SRPBCC domain-containing protein [Chitinophagaceae bacterium]|nr:SRPBCC domain-containing protein [Chitinophagaceae bacterium]